VEELDRFFGYDPAPVKQLREPPWDEALAHGIGLRLASTG